MSEIPMQADNSEINYCIKWFYTHLIYKILCHLAKNVRRYLRHSIGILANKPQYAGSCHWYSDGVCQLSHVAYDFIVCCWLHDTSQTQTVSK